MAITSGFFNSISGDRTYNADDMSNYFDGIVSDGVFESIGDRLQVTAGDSMSVNVGTGRALLNCKWMTNDAVLNLPVSPADVQLSRWDVVAIKLDLIERTMTIEVFEGTPALNPAYPTLKDTQNVKYLRLARITVRAGATSITQNMITDFRGSSYCPWVTGVVDQVDTSDLFTQYQTAYEQMMREMEAWKQQQTAAYEQWFSTLTGTLTIGTTLSKYQESYVTETSTSSIPLISNYADGDVLLVHINGVLFVEGAEYTVNTGTGNIELVREIRANNTVTQILIKNEIGYGGGTVTIANAAVIAAAVDTDPEAVQGTATKEEI